MDRFQIWLAASRPPIWLIYLLVWLVFWGLVSGPVLLSGNQLPARALRGHAGFSANAVLFLAVMHYLDNAAERAIGAFRSATKVDHSAFLNAKRALTTMPARPVLLVSVFGVILPVALSPISVPAMRQYYLATSPLSIAMNVGLVSTLQGATFGVFVFHTIRQLRTVSLIHREQTQISLFRLQSLYGLSSLTAKTAFALVIIGVVAYATAGSNPDLSALSNATVWSDPVFVGVGYLLVSICTAAAVFGFPLVGLPRMLVEEKARLQAENDQRLEEIVEKLHRLVDRADLDSVDALEKTLSSLTMERDVIRRTPTWPWSPGALGVLVSAVLLPITVWLLQRLFERILLP